MQFPFSVEDFLGVFRAYNLVVWPAQIPLYLLGLVLVACLLIPLAGCDAVAEDPAGAAAADTVRVGEPLLAIGGSDEAGTLFQSIQDIAIGPDGSVLVADLGGRVAVFDSGGAWLADLGARGDGPGEHRQPTFVRHTGDSVAVWDSGLRRLSFYRPDGEFAHSRNFPELTAQKVALGKVLLVERETGQTADPAPAVGFVLGVPADGSSPDTLVGPYPVPEYGWEIIDMETQTGAMVMPPAFSVRPVWTVCAGRLLWADPSSDSLVVRDLDDGSRAVVSLPVRALPVTAEDREAFFEAQQARWGLDEETAARMREDIEFARVRPTVTGIVCDASDRPWLAGFDPRMPEPVNATGTTWQVLDSAGGISAEVSFPKGFRLHEILGTRAYGVNRTELGVDYVEVYSLPGKLALESE